MKSQEDMGNMYIKVGQGGAGGGGLPTSQYISSKWVKVATNGK